MQRSPYTTDVSLIFTPNQKWTKSTRYIIKVPASISSIYKETLPRESLLEFFTPTIQVEKPIPLNNVFLPVKTIPFFIVRFDQKIQLEEVIKVVKFKVINVVADAANAMQSIFSSTFSGNTISARLCTTQEIENDPQLKNISTNFEGRYLAFAPVKSLANSEKYVCTIGPNIPSSEGPIRSMEKFQFTFQTVPQFTVTNCVPADRSRSLVGSTITINFSNTIDKSKFNASSMLKIEPNIPGAIIDVNGKSIIIKGTDKNPTQMNEDIQYKITIVKQIKDEFEQNVEKDIDYYVTLCCTTFYCSLVAPAQGIIVYDPLLSDFSGKSPTFLVQATNYKEIRVLLYKVDPYNDLKKWHLLERNSAQILNEKSDSVDYLGFGKIVSDKIVKIDNFRKGVTININVDLSPALEDKKIGQVVVVVSPTQKA